jgi:hypothetical protein
MDTHITDLRQQLVTLSGGGRRTSKNRTSGLYATINLPHFSDIHGLRDTTIRFLDFNITTLAGLTTVELGANMGALTWQALNLGATHSTGYEFNPQRVDWCNAIAKLYQLPAHFYTADFNDPTTNLDTTADICFACSVDQYLTDRPRFYRTIANITKRTAYFETNIQDRTYTPARMKHLLLTAGFTHVTYYGDGYSGGNARRRKLFICHK